MLVSPIKTHKIKIGENLMEIIDRYVQIPPKGEFILVVTSKIISLCQGRVVKIGKVNKEELIKKESSYFLPNSSSRYKVSFTITNNMLVPTAGIDESNGGGYYILWP